MNGKCRKNIQVGIHTLNEISVKFIDKLNNFRYQKNLKNIILKILHKINDLVNL